MVKKASVLFVCMGNICRSPAAEAILRAVAKNAERDILVQSAGTEDYHVGKSPDSRMRSAALKRGFSLDSRGRQVQASDLVPGCYDLVVAMDHANLKRLRAMAPGNPAHIRLFSQFLAEIPRGDWPEEVTDPYYGGAEGFEYVLDMLQAGCPNLLSTLLNET